MRCTLDIRFGTVTYHSPLPTVLVLGHRSRNPELERLDPAREARGRDPGAQAPDYGNGALEPTPWGVGSGEWYVTVPKRDRKSTRLNSSHLVISYAVFCLKKKKIKICIQVTALNSTVELDASDHET